VLIPVWVLVGPTAVGKSRLALQLAPELGAEIISADSHQIYRYMDIGTVKPTLQERKNVPHHMIDVVDPDEEFTVADFKKMVEELIVSLWKKGKVPFLVGGSGLYIRALIDGLFPGPGKDPVLRAKLKEEAEREGVLSLHRKLQSVDPEAAIRIHPQDMVRTIRALEVYYLTGRPISYWQEESQKEKPPYRVIIAGLNCERKTLYRMINQRVEKMIGSGLVEEVKNLLPRYPEDLPSLQSLGYREIIGYLKGNYSLAEAVALIKRNTRRYAKRQLTWFRKDSQIVWFDALDPGTGEKIKKLFLACKTGAAVR